MLLENELRETTYGDKKLLVVLDEDDLLNPGETVDRYKLGIDMTYLVKHFG